MKGKVFDIERCSFNDGDGIRTVVYMKGCTLNCEWCHNPEGIFPISEILFHKSRCIRCGRCVAICPEHHTIVAGEVIYLRKNCSACMKCVAVCPNEALSSCGKDMTVGEVLSEIIKDKHYYDASGGGVTFSGGECLIYPNFLLDLLKICNNNGIDTAVETSLNIKWNNIETIRNYVDTFIIDIKHFDSNMHKKFTGHGNKLILNNITRISHLHSRIIIRIPLIPNANDDDENLIGISRLINSLGNGIYKVELLKYNNMASNKYRALGREMKLFAHSPQEDTVMKQKCELMYKHMRPGIYITY